MTVVKDTKQPRLELWQTEWCPSSHRVRQRLTELGLSYTIRQVPVAPQDRSELRDVSGATSIPTLVHNGRVVVGEEAIISELNTHFHEPADAQQHREKAALALQKAKSRWAGAMP